MVRFGPFRFDPTTGSLWRGAEFLPLLPKDTAVLGMLVQHAGRIVTKDALLDAVWPQTYVTDTVIKNGIGRLRRVLGDDPKVPQYIQTFPRRGYRFVGTVETQEQDIVPEVRPSSSAVGETGAPSPVAEIEMAAGEALTNICAYAYPRGKSEFEVQCTHDAGPRLCIDIIDHGVPFDPLSVPPPDLSEDPAERATGGLGIFLLRTMVDEMTYRREQNRNILHLVIVPRPS